MIPVSEVVEKIVRQKPFIENALAEGLINLSSLSRYIKPDIENILKKEITEAAILMALKRLVPHIEVSMSRKIEKAIKGFGDIIVRSNLIDFTYKNSDTLIDKHQQLIKKVSAEKEMFYTFSRGVFETTIVISASFSEIVKIIFLDEVFISSYHSISSITIRLPEDNIKTPGLYYYVFKQIAWEGISVMEVISTTNEFTMILRDEDVDRVFSILKRLNH